MGHPHEGSQIARFNRIRQGDAKRVQKRTPILEVDLEIGTVIVRMMKTAARTTVKRV